MSNDYTRHAHRRTILAELQRTLLQRFVSTGGNVPKETLICEEVFVADQEVTQDVLMEVLEELQRREADERIQMTQFEFRRRDGKVLRAAEAEVAREEDDQEERPVVVAKAPKPNQSPGGPASTKAGG